MVMDNAHVLPELNHLFMYEISTSAIRPALCPGTVALSSAKTRAREVGYWTYTFSAHWDSTHKTVRD
jgi:hypothetical protein